MGKPKKLIDRIAREILDQNEFTASGLFGAQTLWEEAERMLRRKVRHLKPQTLGLLASCGKSSRNGGSSGRTSLYAVHCGTWVDKYDSGKQILQDLAMTAICARMWDIMRERDPSLDSAQEAAA